MLTLLLTFLTHISADSPCFTGGPTWFWQEHPPGAPRILHRRVAYPLLHGKFRQQRTHTYAKHHAHCSDDIRFTVNPLSAI